MEPPPLSGRRFRFTIRTSSYNRPAIPRRKSERIPTRGPIADRREYVVVLSSVSLRPAEDASTACGGTMQPSAWGGCGLPLSGRSRRANLLQSLVLAESECESVGNIPTFREFPARKSLPSTDWRIKMGVRSFVRSLSAVALPAVCMVWRNRMSAI